METVEVLVQIPKDLYEGIECRNGELETEYVCDELMKAVDNGIVLPKGHGDLVKLNEVIDIVTEYVPDDDGSVGNTNLEDLLYEVENMERVIEADIGGDNNE